MPALVLYGTPGCHLCEQAEELLLPSLASGSGPGGWENVDISLDDTLLARYGTRIPVLRDLTSGCELAWPFDRDRLLAWLARLHDPESPHLQN